MHYVLSTCVVARKLSGIVLRACPTRGRARCADDKQRSSAPRRLLARPGPPSSRNRDGNQEPSVIRNDISGEFSTEEHQPAAQRIEIHVGTISRAGLVDRKSTRLNSSHLVISYAVF